MNLWSSFTVNRSNVPWPPHTHTHHLRTWWYSSPLHTLTPPTTLPSLTHHTHTHLSSLSFLLDSSCSSSSPHRGCGWGNSLPSRRRRGRVVVIIVQIREILSFLDLGLSSSLTVNRPTENVKWEKKWISSLIVLSQNYKDVMSLRAVEQ